MQTRLPARLLIKDTRRNILRKQMKNSYASKHDFETDFYSPSAAPKLIYVSRECMTSLRLIQGVPFQHIKLFCKLYGHFMTIISPRCNNIIISFRKGVRQRNIVSPKSCSATLENVMRRMEWNNMGCNLMVSNYIAFALLMTSSL